MKLLEAKVGLVTGAGSGLGRATALLAAEEGSKVVVADVNEQSGGETVEQIREAGGDALFVRTDVSDEDQVEAMVAPYILLPLWERPFGVSVLVHI